jgi:hypothetical protein
VRAGEIVQSVFGKVPITPGLNTAENLAPPHRASKAVECKQSTPVAPAPAAVTPLKSSASRRKSHSGGDKEKKDSCVIC